MDFKLNTDLVRATCVSDKVFDKTINHQRMVNLKAYISLCLEKGFDPEELKVSLTEYLDDYFSLCYGITGGLGTSSQRYLASKVRQQGYRNLEQWAEDQKHLYLKGLYVYQSFRIVSDAKLAKLYYLTKELGVDYYPVLKEVIKENILDYVEEVYYLV